MKTRSGVSRSGAWLGCLLLLTIGAAESLLGQATTRSHNRPSPPSAASQAHPSSQTETLVGVTRVSVPSAVYHGARDVYVWLPSGEAVSADRYPVLVFPDAEEPGQFRAALANIQFLIDRQLVPPLMVVGLPYLANRRHELTPAATGTTARLYPAAGGAEDNLRFIADELLPWIDARYPTLATRILVGHSLGGLFALYAMATRPTLFRVVVALSPAIDWNDGALGEMVASRLATEPARRTLFLASGGLEPTFDSATTTFATHLSRLVDSLHATHLTFERQRYANDMHEMTPLPGLVDGLRMAFRPIAVPIDSAINALSQPPDSATILSIVRALEARHDAGVRELDVPNRFPEGPLDLFGRYALSLNYRTVALQLLRENGERYPRSSTAHEAFGEALAAVGDTTAAVAEFHTALAIAKDTLQTTSSIISRTRERGVTTTATNQLRAMHRPSAGRR